MSRLLITAPDSAVGARLSHPEAPQTALAMSRYGARLLAMLERPLPLVGDAAEALRLHSGSQVSAELRTAQLALDWLQHWPEAAIPLPDIYQRGPSAIRDGKTARQIVMILEDHGWLIRSPDGTVVAGVRRREAWRIVRR